jgi:hypothetical protein
VCFVASKNSLSRGFRPRARACAGSLAIRSMAALLQSYMVTRLQQRAGLTFHGLRIAFNPFDSYGFVTVQPFNCVTVWL